jgi:uroporphyrinogen-III synthase
MSGPLTGRTILVTRPAHQASDLVNPLEALGAKTFNLPAIEIAPGSASALDGVVERLGEFDWIVLTSVNGVTALASKLKERGVTWPPGPRLAVIGPATGEAAAASIKPPDAMPTEYVSEEIVGALGEVQDKRILLLRADRARKELAVRLRELGARRSP